MPDPPEGLAVNVTDCPVSLGFGWDVRDTESGGSTVSEMVFELTAYPAASVRWT